MNKNTVNGYTLSRTWFNFCFENPELIKPSHTALYFFIIEHCNRLGWKDKFGLPTTMVMEAIGIKSYNTYTNTLKDLIEFGFITMIERSKNQYSANIVALSNFDKALDNALDEAMIKHVSKQSESTVQSTVQSTDSIDKQINKETNKLYKVDDILKENETIEALMNVLKINNIALNRYFDEFKIPYLKDSYNEIEYKNKLTHFINYVKKEEKENDNFYPTYKAAGGEVERDAPRR